jgi:hypothetical protein
MLSKDFAHGHTTSILSTEACLFHCSGAEKTPGLISLVVDEAENMSQICVSNFTKSYSFYDTHSILNDVNELRYQRKRLYYFQEIQQRSNKEL